MQEKVPRTLYSFEQLEEEGERKKEREQEIEEKAPDNP